MSNDFTSTINQIDSISATVETVQLAEITAVGIQGLAGPTGLTGPGVAIGGTIGQALTKLSGTNYDTTWTTITKSTVGLGNVTNESKATMFTSPTFTGTPLAPTAGPTTNTTQIATTEFVKTAVSNLINSAPAALDTLNELATALGNDANFATTITNSLSLKAPLANPTFTGTLTAATITASADATINGVRVGRGSGNISTNTAYGFGALGSPFVSASNINNVGIGYNSLNTIGAGVATFTNLVGGSGYDDDTGSGTYTINRQLIHAGGTPVMAGGSYPFVRINVFNYVIVGVEIINAGTGFVDNTTVMTVTPFDAGGSGFSIKVGTLLYSNNNIAIGFNSGTSPAENAISIGSNVSAASNTVELGNLSITKTNLYGNIANEGGDVSFSGSIFGDIKFGWGLIYGKIEIGGQYSVGDINIGKSEETQTVNIAKGNTPASVFKYVNIATGTGSGQRVIEIGPITGVATTRIYGTIALNGTVTLGGGVTSTATTQLISLGTDQTTGTLTLGSTGGRGTITLGQSTDTQIVNIATGVPVATKTKTVNIGTSATTAAGTTLINIGATVNSTTTLNGTVQPSALTASQAVFTDASKNLVSKAVTGTGDVVLSSSPSLVGAVTIGSTGDTASIIIGQSTAAQTVNIATGANGASSPKIVNIGTNGTDSSTTITLGTLGASANTINIGNGSNSNAVNIGSTNGGIKTINIGTGSNPVSASQIKIGALFTTGNFASSVTLQGSCSLDARAETVNISGAQSTGAVIIGGSGGTGIITLGRPTSSSQTINIANAVLATGNTQTINVGASAASGSTTNIAIGSTAGTSTTTINGSVTIAGASTNFAAVNVGLGFGSQVSIGHFAGAVQLGNGGDVTVSAYSCYINASDGPVSIQTSAGGGYGTVIGMIGDGASLIVDHSSSEFNSITTFKKDVTVNGNLIINGTTTTINSNTVSVDDKNIELGAVAANFKNGTVTAGSAIVTGLVSTADIIPGSAVTALTNAGLITLPAGTTVASINSTTQITLSQALTGTGGPTSPVTLTIGGATDTTAAGGGITLKGTTDKTISWSTLGWTSSEDFNLVTGKSYKINGTSVLSATTLGSGVTASSLTSLGTIATLNAGTITASNDATINGVTVGRGSGNIATNTAYGFDALGSPAIQTNNTNNVAIGYNTLNQIDVGVATITVTNGGSGYNDDGTDTFSYSERCTFVSGAAATVYPLVILTVVSGIITSAVVDTTFLDPYGYGFTLGSATVMTVPDYAGYGGGGAVLNIGTYISASGNTALGFGAGSTSRISSNSIYIGSGASGAGFTNEIVIGAGTTGGGDNTVTIGNTSITSTTIRNLNTTGSVSLPASGGTVLIGSAVLGAGGTITIGNSSFSATGLMIFGRSTGSQTVGIATGGNSTGTTKTVNIGTGGSATSTNNITIGPSFGTGTIAIGNSINTHTVNIATGNNTTVETKTVNIGTNGTTGTTSIAIGSSSGTNSTTTLNGAVTILPYLAGVISIGNTAGTGTITLGQSTVAQITNIQAGATASGSTKTLNIGTGGLTGSTTTITIGSTAGTSNTTLRGGVTVTGDLTLNTTGSKISDFKGDVRAAPIQSKSSAYVLVAADAGQTIYISTGGVTINASILSAGDMVTIVNNSASNQTITAGASVTFRLAGTATTGNRTLAQYGMATFLCVVGGATPTFHCSGAGLT